MGGFVVYTALIVDDEADMRALLRATIEMADQGLAVAGEASDGLEALDRWRDHEPDVVILDHRMPNLNGLETAARILSEKPDQDVVLFSAYLSEDAEREAAALGVRACVSKDDLDAIPAVLWGFAPPA
jgi:YesN/AraC family two-component response regulator